MNKAVRLVAAAAASLLLLGGCAQSPGTAATVDGVKVSESSVQQASAAVTAAFGAAPGEATTFAVNRTIQGVLAERIAADNGITITEADRAGVLAQQPQLATLALQKNGKALADDWIDISIVAQSLGNEKLLAELAKHKVVVNPRYGTWDPAAGATSGSGSLSTEALPKA